LLNVVSEEVLRLEHRAGGCTFDELRPLVNGVRGRTALQDGQVDGGVIWAGQVVGLIEDVPTCADLLQRMASECRSRLSSAMAWC
jgi:nitronate monooxygenase